MDIREGFEYGTPLVWWDNNGSNSYLYGFRQHAVPLTGKRSRTSTFRKEERKFAAAMKAEIRRKEEEFLRKICNIRFERGGFFAGV